MQPALFDQNAKKKATNVSINSDLFQRAKALKINLSKTLEMRLAELIKEEQIKEWRKKNQKAITTYNHRIAADGVFSDGIRCF